MIVIFNFFIAIGYILMKFFPFSILAKLVFPINSFEMMGFDFIFLRTFTTSINESPCVFIPTSQQRSAEN